MAKRRPRPSPKAPDAPRAEPGELRRHGPSMLFAGVVAMLVLAPTVPLRWVALAIGSDVEAQVISTGSTSSLRGRRTEWITVRWEHDGIAHERELPADVSVREELDRALAAAPPPIDVRTEGVDDALAARVSTALGERLAGDRVHVTVRWVPWAPVFSCLLDDGGYGNLYGGIVVGLVLAVLAWLFVHDLGQRRGSAQGSLPGAQRRDT